MEKWKTVKGYKCFNKGLVNRYGLIFEVGKTYHTDENIQFGNEGHGFHMCKRMEDTFRYFDTLNGQIDICEVTGSGKIHEVADEYNGYYDMYACEYLRIDKLLTREEIIYYGLNLYKEAVCRFIQTLKLTPEEIALFKIKYKNDAEVLAYLAYYQENDKEVFERKERKRTNY